MLRVGLILFLLTTCLILSGQVLLPADSIVKLLEKNPQRDTNRVLLLNQLAFANYYNDPVISLRYGFESRAIADSLHFTRGEADAIRQIGMAFWSQADMTTAINYFLTGLRIAEVNGHKQVEADLTGNIGTAYNGMSDPQEALKFLLRAQTMQRELKNKWREASVLNNLGDSYLALKEFNKARAAYSEAMRIAIENNYPLGVTTNLRNLGNIFEQEEKYDSALNNYFKCIELSSRIKDRRGFILSHKSIASVYLKNKKLSLAKKFATTGLEEAIRLHLRAFTRDLYELLSQISEAEGNQVKAYEYFRLFTIYKDSVQNLRILSDIAADRLRFETERKQSEIELLKKESELQSAEIQFQNSRFTIISISLTLTLAFLILAIVNYRKVITKNKLLTQTQDEIHKKNITLSDQSTEMATLNRELQAQQRQVITQRDELVEKNKEIALMNDKVNEVNQNLEKLVSIRTKVLIDQNQRLSEYTFFNAHQLRSPVASILGLVNLLLHTTKPEEHLELLQHLETSAQKLDEAIRSINNTLQEGIHPTEKK
jgi:tetratricopeptide (TPR) repeat protein